MMEKDLIQIFMAFLGTIGFAIFFNIRKSRLLPVGIGGGLVWVIFLLVNYNAGNEMAALFAASAAASIFAEVLARVVKSPGTVLLTPMLIPLVPGGNLYYTMFYLVQGVEVRFRFYLSLVMKEAASIALGIMVVTSIMQIIRRASDYRKRRLYHSAP